MHDTREIIKGFFNNSLSKFETDEQYKELAVLLAVIRGLSILHQSHHWQTGGESYFADHLLFQKLYDKTNEQIDILAEKVVGVGDATLTNYFIQVRIVLDFLKLVNRGDSYMRESLRGERFFLSCGELVLEELKRQGIATEGVLQCVGDMLDVHEGHVYLLKQRVSS